MEELTLKVLAEDQYFNRISPNFIEKSKDWMLIIYNPLNKEFILTNLKN